MIKLYRLRDMLWNQLIFLFLNEKSHPRAKSSNYSNKIESAEFKFPSLVVSWWNIFECFKLKFPKLTLFLLFVFLLVSPPFWPSSCLCFFYCFVYFYFCLFFAAALVVVVIVQAVVAGVGAVVDGE